MSASLVTVVLVGVLFATGIYVMLERSLTRILVGFVLLGNGVNLLIFTMIGRPGEAALVRDGVDPAEFTDPLPQALILTAIVINFGLTAFLLALLYRSWWLARLSERGDDVDTGDDLDEDSAETDVVFEETGHDAEASREEIAAGDRDDENSRDEPRDHRRTPQKREEKRR